jgi:transcriptional regulator with XRE-family HTH domain
MTNKNRPIEQQARLFIDDCDDLALNSLEVISGPTRIYAIVKPEMLQWGRQYAYLSITDAAQKIGISVEKLREWENGVSSPTVNQLHKIAHAYKQLFAVFYLQDPPFLATLPLKDFRRLPSGGLSSISHELACEIRVAINRREIALRMTEEMEEDINEFSLAARLDDKPSEIAMKVREVLFSDVLQIPSFADKQTTFRFFREKLEKRAR